MLTRERYVIPLRGISERERERERVRYNLGEIKEGKKKKGKGYRGIEKTEWERVRK